jgi:hypothetical protein
VSRNGKQQTELKEEEADADATKNGTFSPNLPTRTNCHQKPQRNKKN